MAVKIVAVFLKCPSDSRSHHLYWTGLIVLFTAVWTLGWAPVAAQATTQTFYYIGAEQTFTVPVGVSSVQIIAVGGSGGASEFAGGVAAKVTVPDLKVTPGQTLYVEVGGDGDNGGAVGGAGGFNGGGTGGGEGAAGGGGASDVRTAPRSTGLSPDDRLIVAGGGGGNGGPGTESVSGVGGAAGSGGEESPDSEDIGGGAGTDFNGGSGGYGSCESGTGGELGSGGKGGLSGDVEGGPGGGGGGGYYGGGGGGGGCTFGAGAEEAAPLWCRRGAA